MKLWNLSVFNEPQVIELEHHIDGVKPFDGPSD